MYAASLAGLALIIGLLAVAAIGLGLLTRAGRDRVVLARLTSFFAILTLIGAGLSAIATCYASLFAAEAGVTVVAYDDHPHGTVTESRDGAGQFTQVVLRPVVTITHDSDPETAAALHARVPEYCFIARSVNFPVNHEPTIRVA